MVHIVADSSTCIQHHYTVYHTFARLFWEIILVDYVGVSVERNDIEDHDEAAGEGSKECELPNIVDDCFEYVGEKWYSYKVVKKMYNIPLNAHKVAHDCSQHEDQNGKETWLVAVKCINTGKYVPEEVIEGTEQELEKKSDMPEDKDLGKQINNKVFDLSTNDMNFVGDQVK